MSDTKTFLVKSKIDYILYLKADHWKKFRKRAIKHHGEWCKDCNRYRDGLEVHHLHYLSLWCEGVEDVVVLCPECHKKRHGIETPEPRQSRYRREFTKEDWDYMQWRRGLRIKEKRRKLVKMLKRGMKHKKYQKKLSTMVNMEERKAEAFLSGRHNPGYV